ncbi:hypothetical protein GCM10007276_10680 [Agaricicola taiwanensis]|uniref:Uncharacterized protein n=1 Tax=Agaricicola taiwanensis TaxID=591372 RepID=A0A8J2VNV9_9RHOB|nr:hypothetical protein GCM10007276_10680 [Agaricicola taiwanensis]
MIGRDARIELFHQDAGHASLYERLVLAAGEDRFTLRHGLQYVPAPRIRLTRGLDEKIRRRKNPFRLGHMAEKQKAVGNACVCSSRGQPVRSGAAIPGHDESHGRCRAELARDVDQTIGASAKREITQRGDIQLFITRDLGEGVSIISQWRRIEDYPPGTTSAEAPVTRFLIRCNENALIHGP